MDTNSLIQLVQAMKQSGSPEWFSPTLITAAVGALMALAALMQARTAAIKATISEANTKAAAVTAEQTSGEVVKIHEAVNSRDSAMQKELEKLRNELLRLTGVNVGLEENQRLQKLAEAKAQGAKDATAATGPIGKQAPAAVVEIVAPASAGGGSLSDEQLAQWIQTLQQEQAARAKK